MQWASSTTTASTDCWQGELWNSSNPFLLDKTDLGCVNTRLYLTSLASLSNVGFVSLQSNSNLARFVVFLTLKTVALIFPSVHVLLLIWSLINEFNGETTTTTGRLREEEDVDRELNLSRKDPVEGGKWSTSGNLLAVSQHYPFLSIHVQCALPPSILLF